MDIIINMNQQNFWQELPKPFFILAPMEDVTDVVFRHVISEAGRPDVFFTEFTNKGWRLDRNCQPSTNCFIEAGHPIRQ